MLWNLGYAKYLAAADQAHDCVGGWQGYLDWLQQHRFNGVFFVLQPTGINTCSTCWDGVAPWAELDGEPAPRWGRRINDSVDYYVTPWARSGSPNTFGDSASNVDFQRFYLPLWQNIDAIVQELQRKGMIAHVVMYNDESFYPGESSADERRYWDYIIRRLGGFWNVVYNDGVDLFEYRSAGWVGSGSSTSRITTPSTMRARRGMVTMIRHWQLIGVCRQRTRRPQRASELGEISSLGHQPNL